MKRTRAICLWAILLLTLIGVLSGCVSWSRCTYTYDDLGRATPFCVGFPLF